MSRIKEFYTVLNASGALEYKSKDEIVMEASGNRTTHSKELTAEEMNRLIAALRTPSASLRMSKGAGAARYAEDKLNPKRRRIISKFMEMGCVTAQGKADMDAVQQLVQKHWKKALNDYKAKELANIIAILENKWLPWYYKQKALNKDFTVKPNGTN